MRKLKKGITIVLVLCMSMLVQMCDNLKDSVLSGNSSPKYKRGMTMLSPAENWREGLPSGNGTIAALVYGSINRERVLFNHNELWYEGKISEIPDMSAELPVVRKLMLDGNYLEANEHYRNTLREKGFNARNAVYHPPFDMILTTSVEESGCDGVFIDQMHGFYLASFLIGAQPYSFLQYGWGVQLKNGGALVDYPEFSKPLGSPHGA